MGKATRIALTLVIQFLLPVPALSTSSATKPTETAFLAWETGEQCRSMRAVLRKAQSQVENLEALRTETRKVIAERAQKLTTCGGRATDVEREGQRGLAALAEACPDEYMDWMTPGVSRMVFEEDLDELRDSIAALSHTFKRQCIGSLDKTASK